MVTFLALKGYDLFKDFVSRYTKILITEYYSLLNTLYYDKSYDEIHLQLVLFNVSNQHMVIENN